MESDEGVRNAQPDEKTAADAGVNYAPRENTTGSPATPQEQKSAIPPNIPTYKHQPNCMHAGSMTQVMPMGQMSQMAPMNPMYNPNNLRNCHHYCQHQCYRQQPMNTNPGLAMGFGNININSETGITGGNMMRRSEHAMSPDAPDYMQQRNMGYPPNWHNVPHQYGYPHQVCGQEAALVAQGRHKQEAVMPMKVSDDSMAQDGNQGEQQIESEVSGCQGESQRGQHRRASRVEITHMNPVHEQQETNEQHLEQSSAQAHDTNKEETCEQETHEPGYGNQEQEDDADGERYEKGEIRNKREISKGLTSDCAKSLIYFQGDNSDYSRMEAKMEKESTTLRNRRLNQPAAGQAVNSSQSLMNLHHQSAPAQRVLKPARKMNNKNEDQIPAEVPLKETRSCVTYGGEQIINPHENKQPIQPNNEQTDVENATGDMHPDGEECHHSESDMTIGDCLKLNPLAKITRRVRGWDDVKRRNGLE